MTSYTSLITDYKAHILTIYLSRPDKRNAIDQHMAGEILHLLKDAEADAHVRVVVLRGKGKIFSAGADIAWMNLQDLPEDQQPAVLLAKLFKAIYFFQKPLIVLVHGAAMGGALGLIAGADYVLADDTSKFAFSEVRLGLIPATISPFVIRRIGEFKARQLMLSGITFSAEEALEAGLIDKSGGTDEIESYKTYLCMEILKNAPNATKMCKQLIIGVSGQSMNKKLFDYTANILKNVKKGKEAHEGMRAFKEKRKPEW